MALKYKLKPSELETVDDAIKAFYKKSGEGDAEIYTLQVEGVVPPERVTELQTKVSNFRKNNTRLQNRVNVFVTESGITLEDDTTDEELAELLKEKREEIEASLSKGGKGKMSKEEIEAEVTKRLEAIKAKHEADLKKLADEKAKVEADLNSSQAEIASLSIGQEVVRIGADFGLKPKAHKVVIDAALKIFKRQDGKIRCLDAEGDPVYGSDAVTEKSIADWLENEAVKEYDFAFETNSGGGASGGGGGKRNGHSGPNPWKAETRNLTRQMHIEKSDPALANRLKQEAGAKV
jgi:hypothetical protein